ncbi:MAG: DUF6572 domain-containing protein [Myxococcota bacterium]
MNSDLPRRGVANPSVIDLITPEAESGEVVLVVLEDREWSDAPERLKQLEDKLNAYFVYVLDGFLVRQYPRYEGRGVRIRVESSTPPAPGSRTAAMLTAARNYAAANDLNFELRPSAPEPEEIDAG